MDDHIAHARKKVDDVLTKSALWDWAKCYSTVDAARAAHDAKAGKGAQS